MKRPAFTKDRLLCGSLWGYACFRQGLVLKGILICLGEALLLLAIGWTLPYLTKLPTLGTIKAERIWDPVSRRNVWND